MDYKSGDRNREALKEESLYNLYTYYLTSRYIVNYTFSI
jgi:hypothetical protein